MWWNFPDTGIPDCVPEMFREQFERDAREAELEHNRNEHYKANRKKREEAREQGYPILDFGGYDACRHCSYADYDTQISFDDDFDSLICLDPDCSEHQKHKES